MFDIVKKIAKYKRLTLKYPKEALDNSLFIGRTVIDSEKCTKCGACIKRCPSFAIDQNKGNGTVGINYDMCIFCVLCSSVCPVGAISITNEFELAQESRDNLRHTPLVVREELYKHDVDEIGQKIKKKTQKMFGRSLQIREVDAGSCNACDYEINALNNPFNDVERFGFHFVASPRHADMLLVTGTVTRNMEEALLRTYEATPDPKLVVAVGTCAISGGIFRDSYATKSGVDGVIPVDVYVPGCPPRPQAVLYGILTALGMNEK